MISKTSNFKKLRKSYVAINENFGGLPYKSGSNLAGLTDGNPIALSTGSDITKVNSTGHCVIDTSTTAFTGVKSNGVILDTYIGPGYWDVWVFLDVPVGTCSASIKVYDNTNALIASSGNYALKASALQVFNVQKAARLSTSLVNTYSIGSGGFYVSGMTQQSFVSGSAGLSYAERLQVLVSLTSGTITRRGHWIQVR